MARRFSLLLAAVVLCWPTLVGAAGPVGAEGGPAIAAPAGMALDVRAFGAVGDGKTLCTEPIQRGVDAAGQEGGGTLFFPPGTYLTGSIRLRSGVTLHLAAGAVLLGSTRLDDFAPLVPEFRSYTDNYVQRSLIAGEGLHDVAIVGQGTLDGQGDDAAFRRKPYLLRPYLLRLVSCRGVRVEGITFRRSPMWVQHYLACDEVSIRGVTVDSQVNANNDGIDIDCCRNVRVSDCSIRSGDDAICLKSTADRACENVAISNCVLSSLCNGLKMGTESNGGFRNVTIANCSLYGVRLAGLALEMVDGGTLDGVAVSNLTMSNVGAAIFIRLGNRARPFVKDGPKPGMGALRNVVISNLTATGCGKVGSSITGLPGHPVEGVQLSNIRIRAAGGGTTEDAGRAVPENEAGYPEYRMFGTLPAHGLTCRHVEGLRLRDVDLGTEAPDRRPALLCDDVRDLDVDGLRTPGLADAAPAVILQGVVGALLRGCRAAPGTNVFLSLRGECDRVSLFDSDLSRAATPFELQPPLTETCLHQSGNRLK